MNREVHVRFCERLGLKCFRSTHPLQNLTPPPRSRVGLFSFKWRNSGLDAGRTSVSADMVMMAGEGAVKMLAILTRRDFGMLKTCFDVCMVGLGALLSLLLFSELRGIGEGTIVAAIFVGMCVKLFHSLRRRFI